MQVLGSLIHLPKSKDALPLPWWHRAPLGLLDRTTVYLAVVGTRKRPVGNLIVSVLNPSYWKNMIIIQGHEEDQPGAIAQAFGAVFPLNIAVAETVTLEAGDEHHVSIICEPFGDSIPDDPKQHVAQRLLEHKLTGLTPRRFLEPAPSIPWHDVFQVEHGWIRETRWRERIQETYPAHIDQVDLERAVVSADTERRLLRFLFPRKGAFTVRIEHADRPGALRSIAEVFRQCHLNVVSALLRRGGAKPKNALLVAICEPHHHATAGDHQGQLLHELATQLPQELRAHPVILEPEDPANIIYSHHPDELVARIPAILSPLVADYRRNLPPASLPIFLSRRFLSSHRREKIVQRVKSRLTANGCLAIEAHPEPGQLSTSLTQVSAKMWLSRAGIVLVSGGVDQAFSMNLAHEAGFLQGQGKPVLLLVEEGSERGMEHWTNANGLVAPRFPADDRAFDPEEPNSLDKILDRWIGSLAPGFKWDRL